MKFSIKDFFSKCDQIRSFLHICTHLLKKSLNEKLHFLCSEGTDFYRTKKLVCDKLTKKWQDNTFYTAT